MSVVDFINKVLGKPISPIPEKSPVQEFLDKIFVPKTVKYDFTKPQTQVQAKTTQPTATPKPVANSTVLGVQSAQKQPQTQTPDKFPYTKEQYVTAVKEGFKNWFGDQDVPVTHEIEAIYNEAVKYPIYYKYPFLIPAISFLETRGGRDLQPGNDAATPHKKYNATSWAIYVKPEDWTPSSLNEVLTKTTSGIGERTSYYDQFRKTGDLLDLGNVYAPPSDNGGENGTGGATYAKNLRGVMDVFDEKVPKME